MNTMGERFTGNWRVLAATLFSAVLVVGAYMLARGIGSPPSVEASTETALLQAIAARDSDNDGLPDWEEALFGTSPSNPDTFTLGMTDGMAVARGLIVPKAIANVPVATSSLASLDLEGLPPPPAEGTLTSAFARSFFMLYLSAKEAKGGGELSETDMQNVANEALASLSSAITPAPDFKSEKDLTISGSGQGALKAFAVSAEAVLLKNTSNATTSEIVYLKQVLENDDTTALPRIASIAKAYRDSAAGLAVLPVPQELASVTLALINAMMRTSEIANDFTRVDTDPLVTMLALHQYPQTVASLGEAFIDVGTIYQTTGISLPAGTPGASFVNLIADVAASQQAAQKP